MSNQPACKVEISGRNTCVILWVAQAVIDRGFQAVIDEEHRQLVDKFFSANPLITCMSEGEIAASNIEHHILIKAKTDTGDDIPQKTGKRVVAGIGFSPKSLNELALKYNPHRTIGADIVFGPGCHNLPLSGLTKSIGSAFNGSGFRLPYTGERCYAYVEDFATAVVDALFVPSPSNFSPVQIGERVSVDEILRDLEYVFPYNGITANGPKLENIFDDARLLPHTLLEGIEKSRNVLRQLAAG